MRVVLVVPSFPQVSETFIISKFLGLLKRGWDVHVVCGTSSPEQLHWFPELEQSALARKRVHRVWPVRPKLVGAALVPAALVSCLASAPARTALYLWKGIRLAGSDILRRLYLDYHLIKLRPAVVHFEFGALAVGRMYLKELLNCRIVVSFRGYDLNFSGLEQEDYYSEVWQKADMLHFLGEDLRRRALRRGCPPDRPHMLIPPALDIRRFNPSAQSHTEVLGTENRPLRLLSVGRLEWKKGYEHALQAVRFLKDRGIKLVYRIVGAGQYIEAVAFCRYQLGLEDCVELLGAMPQEQVLEQMKWADVFLHAAVSEGFCNAVLEAQAMKLPVVCSDAGGLPDNVADGVTGFVVPRRNPKAMADKLELLAANPELRRRMGNAGRERVESCFRLEDQIDRFEKLYLTVLDQERPGMGKGVISGEG